MSSLPGGVLASEISRSYNSFAGADIKAVIGQFQFAELQAISYSVTREKAPIYTMGSCDPRAYSRNKRGIAGSLVWINFDRHALLNLFQMALGTFVADADEIRPQFSNVANGTAVFQSSVVRDTGPSISSTINALDQETMTSQRSDKRTGDPLVLRPDPALRRHALRCQRVRRDVRGQDLRSLRFSMRAWAFRSTTL